MLPALITHKSTTIRKNTGIASFSCSRGTAWNGLRKLLDLNIRLGCEKCSSVRVFGRRNHTRRVTAFQDLTRIHYGEFVRRDRKSTRLNSSHVAISYAVFCLKNNK